MCGIFGFSLNHPLQPKDVELGISQLSKLDHRGPDGMGNRSFEEDGVFVGHRRLAILDTSDRASQPMVRHGLTLAHNGEIYNFVEIRDKLSKAGYDFDTGSDTEVLLAAWSRHGADCLGLFDGMFAFVLFDGTQTHLVTDPFGEKPLYLAQTDQGVYYSSEPQPLVESLSLRFDPSEEETAAFLALGFLPAPSTGYGKLKVLEPGSHVVIRDGKVTRRTRYWVPDMPEVRTSKVQPVSKQDVDRVADVLIDSVNVRLRSDVPMSTFLSSGVDSALVAAIAEKELNVRVPAITVGFPSSTVADESDGASRIAAHLGLDHQVITSDGMSEDNPLNQLISLYGCPIDNPTALPVYDMSRLARKSATVALSGIGSDEIFYGYNRYQLFYKRRRLLALDGPLRIGARWISNVLGKNTGSELLRHSSGWSYANFKNIGNWDVLDRVSGMAEWGREFFHKSEGPQYLASRHFDLTNVMPSSYIPAIERSSMRVGLEVRTPFLNRKVLSVVDNLDPRSLIAYGQKNVVRQILNRYLPEELIFEGKRGFNSPLESIVSSSTNRLVVGGLSNDLVEAVDERKDLKRGRDLYLRMMILSELASL